jgi:hypothetical protein
VAAYAEWVSGPRQDVSIRVGFQKTWHDGEPDRDLLVATFRHLPFNGWNIFGSVWIDFYTGSDNVKGSGAEVTQAVATLGRTWKSGSGFDLTYTHVRFPELLRQGEFLPPANAADIANDRNDRIALNAWWFVIEQLRLHMHASGWQDEDEEGGAGEFGFEVRDFVVRASRFDVTAFVGVGQYEDAYGVRGSYGRYLERGYWELLYEAANHHEQDFPSNLNDILHHRARGSFGLFLPSGWDITLYVEVRLWDVEAAWVMGMTVQKDF